MFTCPALIILIINIIKIIIWQKNLFGVVVKASLVTGGLGFESCDCSLLVRPLKWFVFIIQCY